MDLFIKPVARAMVLFGALALAPVAAQAAGTAANTTINNTATLDYSVGGVAQTQKSSNTSSFVVDNKVNLTVVGQDAGGTVSVIPGGPGAGAYYVQTYLVTNTGNASDTFALSAAAVAGDQFDLATAPSIYVEDGTTPGFQVGEDTLTSSTGALAADAGKTVYIVSAAGANEVPATQVNNDLATYALTATTAQTATAPAAATLAAVDTFFADGAGATDAANDGKFSAQESYKVATAVISVNKTVSIVDDGLGGTSAAIPGATLEYTVTVSNAAGSATATLTNIGDALNANLTPVETAGVATWAVTGSTRATASGTLTLDTGAGATTDGLSHDGAGNVTIALGTVMAADAVNGYVAGELKAGESVAVTFRVTIN